MGDELDFTSDFYDIEAVLEKRDRELLASVRAFMRDEVAPTINEYWSKEEFPHELWPRFAELGIGGVDHHGYGCPGRGTVVDGFLAMELAAVDCSVATGLGVHSHLAMGSILMCGSEEQKGALASSDGSLREDRGVRDDRAGGRLGRSARDADDRPSRRRHLGA